MDVLVVGGGNAVFTGDARLMSGTVLGRTAGIHAARAAGLSH
ncbi:MAG: hypothetical protein AB7T07_10445 [Steroidobacteraceae bacterium]